MEFSCISEMQAKKALTWVYLLQVLITFSIFWISIRIIYRLKAVNQGFQWWYQNCIPTKSWSTRSSGSKSTGTSYAVQSRKMLISPLPTQRLTSLSWKSVDMQVHRLSIYLQIFMWRDEELVEKLVLHQEKYPNYPPLCISIHLYTLLLTAIHHYRLLY